MFGLLLAGGKGTRLGPLTVGVSKHLLGVYNKPMIYYSLSTLLLAGIREIFVVVNPKDVAAYGELLGDGSDFGCKFTFLVQEQSDGIAATLKLVPATHSESPFLVVLGDNLIYGSQVGASLGLDFDKGCRIFVARVSNPEDFGVLELSGTGEPLSIVEKPKAPAGNLAVIGIYFFDAQAFKFLKELKPSKRGELEITDLLKPYLEKRSLEVRILPRGTAWLDTGKPESLNRASQFVEAIELNQGLLVGSPHEVAWRNGWITSKKLREISNRFVNSSYGTKLQELSGFS